MPLPVRGRESIVSSGSVSGASKAAFPMEPGLSGIKTKAGRPKKHGLPLSQQGCLIAPSTSELNPRAATAKHEHRKRAHRGFQKGQFHSSSKILSTMYIIK